MNPKPQVGTKTKLRLEYSKSFSEKKWSERADFAESCFSKLKTNKETYAVALAFQYGPKVVFDGDGNGQSSK